MSESALQPEDFVAEAEVRISPQGRIFFETRPRVAGESPQPAAARISRAFEDGADAGLLNLAAAELETDLPPSLAFWRSFARLFLTQACKVPDLDEKKESLQVPLPREELADLLSTAPPMTGGEYLDATMLERMWGELESALRDRLMTFKGSAQEFLRQLNPLWNVVGRVCFHLAENKQDESRPFAFLATYASRLSSRGKVQHAPLARAFEESSGAGKKEALLALLVPVQKASGRSDLVKELLESGEIFHPLAWTPQEAFRFLKDIPLLESAGVVVRVPDWWKARKMPRAEAQVTIGRREAAGMGLDALLDFSLGVALDGEALSEKEIQEILNNTAGLALIRGKWVEIDGERLAEVLKHWKSVEKTASRGGLSFIEGMRLLSGAGSLAGGAAEPQAVAAWSTVVAGDWFEKMLRDLRSPQSLDSADPGPELRAVLRPYQKAGVEWLRLLNRLGLGACLADDMGLGKTIQVLSLLLLLKRRGRDGKKNVSLIVVPASLLGNWKAEIEKFAPSLKALMFHPSAMPPADLAASSAGTLDSYDLAITTYGYLSRQPWLGQIHWDLVVLDEAQALKNPGARQTRTVKSLISRHRIALTGTPVENRLSDLWSLFDFICPGLLGTAAQFNRFVKDQTRSQEKTFGSLRGLVRPYILRRMKIDKSIIADLPEKTELLAFCQLSKAQAVLYRQAVEELARKLEPLEGIQRRGVVLAFLMRFKQICNHPSHWLGDGVFEPAASGKFSRLRELCEEIADKQEKALVFTQFREMTGPLAGFLEGVFKRPGLTLHGQTQVGKRKQLVEDFQKDGGPPFMVLSLKAGGTGLNLTAASHVIHFDRWWNPAVENQATDRAFRIGQKRNVLVHKFVCRGTVEEKIDALIVAKQQLSAEILDSSGETLITELSDEKLLALVSLDIHSANSEN